jgi:hypothetical protein
MTVYTYFVITDSSQVGHGLEIEWSDQLKTLKKVPLDNDAQDAGGDRDTK